MRPSPDVPVGSPFIAGVMRKKLGERVELYTVDRLGTLAEGSTCQLQHYNDVSPEVLAEHSNSLFPDGLSRHGEMYFLRAESQVQAINPMLELFFEQVRRASFPDKPSRMQSMFAVDCLSSVRDFKIRFKALELPVYKVKAETVFRADMGLLYGGNSALVTSWFASQYWKGEAGPEQPFWEWVLKCPVEIGERIA
ncbi:hypothetical protein HALTITAN_2033 [Vreelandella titanicae BH1]|uniref:Uncharacterized protein n=1 Tax=Vreelandella titanicae BH1 TaxID=1204738 RepID=L9U8I1_9GAMM|nr:hypothetical protein HALTITAN_2033 [Halomonas titanicae BH1]